MKKVILYSLAGLLMFSGCVDMDIPKKNVVSQETIMSNTAGMEKYMTRLYTLMPYEDFKYNGAWGLRNNGWLVSFGDDGSGETVQRGDEARSFVREDDVYWNTGGNTAKPFMILRDINVLLENFPQYKANFAEIDYNNYLGQAYFMRAFIFYAMAKRFGGVPLVTRTINYPNDEVLEIPRSSEEETWDQVLADFDTAISLLSDNSADITLVNRYVALAYKAEAMNYAGSVAKYNEENGLLLNDVPVGTRTGVKVIGFDNGPAASAKYFTEAYKAANAIITSGRYSLRTASSNTPQALYENLVGMFTEGFDGKDGALIRTNPENMWVREYLYPTTTHSFDSYNLPAQFRVLGASLSGGTNPTLDFVELFDGLERNAEGRIKVTTGNNNASGNYILYDSPFDLFANVEPRLRAWVLLPGDTFKGETIDLRAGTYTGPEASIAPLGNSNGGYEWSNAGKRYDGYSQYGKTMFRSDRETVNSLTSPNTTVPYNGDGKGVKIYPADSQHSEPYISGSGASGPFRDTGEASLTGFSIRKWLVPDPSFTNPFEGSCDQPFVLMRYADVLLAAAESAVELSIAGVASPDGSDMLSVATAALKSIQTRAGATVMTGSLVGTTDSRDIVRKERRKELALEHKSKWDLRRWRVMHRDGRDGFWGVQTDAGRFSNNSEFRFRGLYPFFSTSTGKWFFDDRYQERDLKTFGYNDAGVDYYFEIPQGEVAKSLVIDQQPNRSSAVR